MTEDMQRARITEAREYIRASRRRVELAQDDIVIHRTTNGYVIQTPGPDGFLTERVVEVTNEPLDAPHLLLTALADYLPELRAVVT